MMNIDSASGRMVPAMAPLPAVPQQPENTAFIKELQWKENRSQDEFLGQLLSDETLAKDHIALKHSSSSASSNNDQAKSRNLRTRAAASADDPQIYTQLSVNLWKRVNAGYLVPKRPPIGVTKATFTYDPGLVEKQSKEFHRKRDFYSEYNEAAARFKLVLGNKKPLSKKAAGKRSDDTKLPDAKGRSSPPPPSAGSTSAAMPLDGQHLPPDSTNNLTSNLDDNNSNQNDQYNPTATSDNNEEPPANS